MYLRLAALANHYVRSRDPLSTRDELGAVFIWVRRGQHEPPMQGEMRPVSDPTIQMNGMIKPMCSRPSAKRVTLHDCSFHPATPLIMNDRQYLQHPGCEFFPPGLSAVKDGPHPITRRSVGRPPTKRVSFCPACVHVRSELKNFPKPEGCVGAAIAAGTIATNPGNFFPTQGKRTS